MKFLIMSSLLFDKSKNPCHFTEAGHVVQDILYNKKIIHLADTLDYQFPKTIELY